MPDCLRTCYAPEWCKQTEACAIEVRLRWRKGRRTGFKGEWNPATPRMESREDRRNIEKFSYPASAWKT